MFRFTIRDVLWLMVVASLVCAWWADRSAASLARKDYESRLGRLDLYLHQIQADGLVSNESETYVMPRNGGEPILVQKRPF